LTLWEGHTREALDRLVLEVTNAAPGDSAAFAAAFVGFMASTGTGFSASAFGDRFRLEVAERCAKKTKGKPALIQTLARPIVDDPSHRGVAAALQRVLDLKIVGEPLLEGVRTDCEREFREAIRLGGYSTAEEGLADITHCRTHARPSPAPRAISTIYKAKGLECGSVIVLPCDKQTFPNKHDARCLLYVALSRATNRLMLVLSRHNPSPLFLLPPLL
jgi:DNA helicase-2/ATP-dependent DNA helicase PcrA